MKKLLVVIVLIACLAAVAFATLSSTSKKQGEVKKDREKGNEKETSLQSHLLVFLVKCKKFNPVPMHRGGIFFISLSSRTFHSSKFFSIKKKMQ